jgi:hypothetical protein
MESVLGGAVYTAAPNRSRQTWKYVVRTSSLQTCSGRKLAHNSSCCSQVGAG